MTTVTIYRNNKKTIGFTSCGHAGYAEAGEDIVCAALSVLMINTINSIDAFTDVAADLNTDEEEGKIDFQLKKTTKETELLMSSLVLGLESLVEDELYAKYIQLTIEEV